MKTKTLFSTATYILAVASILCASISATAYEKIDSVVAVVGDDVVFQSELTTKEIQITNRLHEINRNIDQDSLQKNALNALILEKIQLKLAQQVSKMDNKLLPSLVM